MADLLNQCKLTILTESLQELHEPTGMLIIRQGYVVVKAKQLAKTVRF